MASFNAELTATSITPTSVQLLGPEGNSMQCDLSTTASSVHVVPSALLPGGTRFTLQLGSSIADSAGRTLAATAQHSFTTAAQAWSPTAMDVGAMSNHTALTYPSMVAMASGDVMLAWHIVVAGSDTIFASHYRAQTGIWSAPETLYATAQFGALGPLSMAACPNDDVVLFWSERVQEEQSRGARYSSASGTWSTLGSIQTVPMHGWTVGPTVVVDSQGNIMLVSSTGGALYAVRFDVARGTWSLPQRIDHPVVNGYLLSLRVTVDPHDVVIAAWIQQNDSFGRDVYAARYDPAAEEWGAAQLAGSNAMQHMAMGVDATGAISIVWATGHSISVPPSMWASRWSPDQAQWSTKTRLDQDSMFGVGAPVLACDAAGHVTAAWMQEGTPRAARYDPGPDGGWSAPQEISSETTGGETHLTLVADPAGNLTLALTEIQNQPMAFRYSATDAQWRPGVRIGVLAEGAPVFANDPVAVVDRASNVTMAWFAWNSIDGTDAYVVSVNRLQ